MTETKELEQLLPLLQSYYQAHQVSRSVNILDVALQGLEENTPLTHCICEYLEPEEGWSRFVQTNHLKNERCFHCRQQLQTLFPGLSREQASCKACRECYLLMCKAYVEGKGRKVRLTSKFGKLNKLK